MRKREKYKFEKRINKRKKKNEKKRKKTVKGDKGKGAHLCLPEHVYVWSCIKTRERER